MQRSKQQALMFLLGALLVGGVVGFSAKGVMTRKPPRTPARVQMYDDIGIAPELRVKMDSVLDETNCKTGDIMRSVRPAMDSVRAEGFKSLFAMMTAEQRAAYDARELRFKARMDSIEKVREAQRAKDHPGSDRPRRCGFGPRPGTGKGPESDRRGPGGPGPEFRNPDGVHFY